MWCELQILTHVMRMKPYSPSIELPSNSWLPRCEGGQLDRGSSVEEPSNIRGLTLSIFGRNRPSTGAHVSPRNSHAGESGSLENGGSELHAPSHDPGPPWLVGAEPRAGH